MNLNEKGTFEFGRDFQFSQDVIFRIHLNKLETNSLYFEMY